MYTPQMATVIQPTPNVVNCRKTLETFALFNSPCVSRVRSIHGYQISDTATSPTTFLQDVQCNRAPKKTRGKPRPDQGKPL